jgi:hypothetical protein
VRNLTCAVRLSFALEIYCDTMRELVVNGTALGFPMKLVMLFFFATALLVRGQTNIQSDVAATDAAGVVSNAPAVTLQARTNQILSDVQRVEQVRNACINGRRSICGRILRIFSNGLVVESGYTNLLRYPLNRSWLAPSTVVASRPKNLVESSEPGSVCVGQIFLTNYPKSRRTRLKPYDYVIIEGYPAGQHTYTSVGNIHKTVRQFSASLEAAVKININIQATNNKMQARAAGVK